jgi:hypothetical protein
LRSVTSKSRFGLASGGSTTSSGVDCGERCAVPVRVKSLASLLTSVRQVTEHVASAAGGVQRDEVRLRRLRRPA